jgi:glycogen debranching enzyme
VYASAGDLYANAVFGRDSVEVAEDLLAPCPDLAHDVILTLGRLQGIVDAPPGPDCSEEEPGRIHHEHRELEIDGVRVSARSRELLEHLSAIWGGDGRSMTYYGSVDATPLYVRLVAAYAGRCGPGILDEPLLDRAGRTVTVRDCVLRAMEWLERRIARSAQGLVEFQRQNPRGIPYQVWKDSGTSYVHRDGRLASWEGPVAAVEVQGYTYDALLGAAGLLGGAEPELAARWRREASALRTRVLERFWMPGEAYFAMGLDRDAAGTPTLVDSVASNGALLLDTAIFDGLPDAERYLGGVVTRVCGPEFLTEVGVRCRSLAEDGLIDFQDYHGTWAVWAKEASDVARGLERQGFPRLAEQVRARLLNGVNVAGEHAEFLYVSPDGRVHYDFRGRAGHGPNPTQIVGTNVPDQAQAWTVSAALAIKLRASPAREGAAGWRRELEDAVLDAMPRAGRLRTGPELETAFARRGDFVIDVEEGWARARAARPS